VGLLNSKVGQTHMSSFRTEKGIVEGKIKYRNDVFEMIKNMGDVFEGMGENSNSSYMSNQHVIYSRYFNYPEIE
jgi:hypothetical protein